MGTDPSSQFSQFLNINLPKTEPIILVAAIARKLRNRIDGGRLHAHIYSIIHNLTQGSFRPADALEFAYQHELHGLNIHVDDGVEDDPTDSTPKQLTEFKAYAQPLSLWVHLETSGIQIGCRLEFIKRKTLGR